jgi:hypothetical protein
MKQNARYVIVLKRLPRLFIETYDQNYQISKYLFYIFIAILCAEMSSVAWSLGLIHTRHFCEQYLDKKKKRGKRLYLKSVSRI